MKRPKRLLSILTMVTVTLGVFSGWNMVSAKAPGNPTLPIAKKPITLKIWTAMDEGSNLFKTYSDSDYYKELEKRTGVHTVFIHPPIGQESSALNLLFASGDYPDIVQMNTGGTEYPGGVDKGISDGVLIKLNDLVKKYAPNYYQLINSSPVIKRDVLTDSGNIRGFNQITKTIQPPWFGTVVRQDWLDELKLKTPVTYDDWYKMLKAFKQKKGAVAPMSLGSSGFDWFDLMNAGYGVGSSFYQVKGKVKFGPLESGYKEYITMISRWYKEGLIDKDFSTKKDLIPSATYTTTGKTGTWNDAYIMLSVDKAKATDPKYRAVAVPLPVKHAGDKLHIGQINTNVKNIYWAITSKCKDPVTAVKWLDYGYSPEGALFANYGIEGKTFTKVNGKPQYTKLMYQNPNGIPLSQTMRKYTRTPSHGGSLYSWERELVGQTPDNLNAGKIWAKNNDGAYIMPSVSLTTDEGTEFASIMGDINTYISEMDIKFILGQEPLSKYDSFVKQIKSMNIQRAIELQQGALNRYYKRK